MQGDNYDCRAGILFLSNLQRQAERHLAIHVLHDYSFVLSKIGKIRLYDSRFKSYNLLGITKENKMDSKTMAILLILQMDHAMKQGKRK